MMVRQESLLFKLCRHARLLSEGDKINLPASIHGLPSLLFAVWYDLQFALIETHF